MRYNPMSTITIRDVAKKAGVSLGTASRVINGTANVAPEFKKKVDQAIRSLGYEPNRMAQGLRSKQSHAIGVIVRDITIPALANFVRAVQDQLERAGYTLLITCSDDRKDRELALLNSFKRRQMDGVVILSASDEDTDLVRARAAFAAPVVLFDRHSPSSLDAVLLDHYGGIRRSIDYLSGLGHRRICLVTGSEQVFPGRERVRAFRDGISSFHGLADSARLVSARGFDAQTAFVETMQMLGRDPAPTAIIAGGISMLPGVLRAIRSRGLVVPQDISVISVGDSDLAVLSEPAVTVLKWDYADLGHAVVQLLLRRIREPRAERERVTFPVDFVVRGSCAAPRSGR